jgi:carbohydrate-selective porin OprB
MILIADRQAIAASGIPMLVRDFETARELTYQWKLAENWFVQPDLQYVIHPGGMLRIQPIQHQRFHMRWSSARERH